ncbi:MAG: MCE family protein [Acidimicrobiaceae bacterium]|nr:MCE family protein [Acidimicrobiaceae bacterium]
MSEPRRANRRRSTFVGALLVCVLLLGGCGFSLQSLPKVGGISGPTYPVKAVFANVLNLPANAQVRLGAQVIGEVGSISTRDFRADVTLQIKKNVHLAAGSTAEVRFDNPLGDEYVLLTSPPYPTPGRFITSGQVIPEDRTDTAPSVEDTLGALSLVLNGGGLNQLQTIVHELNNTFTGNQPQIHSLLGTINAAVTTLSSGQTPVDNALAAIDNLSTKLDAGSNPKTISNGIASLAPAIGVLASENTDISRLLSNLSSLGAVGTQVAQQSGQNSVNDIKDLLPVVQQLDSVSQQLGPALKDLSTFEAQTPKIAPGDYLQVSAVANVVLPPGQFSPPATSSAGPSTGAQAITALLEAGIL